MFNKVKEMIIFHSRSLSNNEKFPHNRCLYGKLPSVTFACLLPHSVLQRLLIITLRGQLLIFSRRAAHACASRARMSACIKWLARSAMSQSVPTGWSKDPQRRWAGGWLSGKEQPHAQAQTQTETPLRMPSGCCSIHP